VYYSIFLALAYIKCYKARPDRNMHIFCLDSVGSKNVLAPKNTHTYRHCVRGVCWVWLSRSNKGICGGL